MKKLLEILAILALPVFASANQTIDVAVVFSNDHGLSVSQKVTWAVDIKRHLDDAFSTFNYSFDVWSAPVNLPYSTGGKSAIAVVDWMQSNSALLQTRDTIGGDGADFVLMVGGSTASTACGRAGRDRPPLGTEPPLSVSIAERDHYAFAVIFIKNTKCSRWEIIIPHEIGHLMHAEHQLADDNNGSPSRPNVKMRRVAGSGTETDTN